MLRFVPRSSYCFVPLLIWSSGCWLGEVETEWECHNSDCSPVDAGASGGGSGGQGGQPNLDTGPGPMVDAGDSANGADSGEGGIRDGTPDGAMEASPGDSEPPGGCDGCSADEVCDPDTATCVECLQDEHCGTERCNAQHTCVECLDSTDCTADVPVCDEGGVCVECLMDTDCTEPSASRCEAKKCVPCTINAHCDGITDGERVLGLCDENSECVECSGQAYSSCGTAAGGAAFVCDSLGRRCTDFEKGSAGPCDECVSDAQCADGLLCMQTSFAGEPAGNYCLWKKDASGAGAPNGSCPSQRPYVGTESGWVSVDGQNVDVCKPARTTCRAQSEFLNKSCAGTTEEGHAECGVPGLADAFCAPFGADHRCTVPCVSFDDCKDTRPGDDMECQSQNLAGMLVDVCQFE